MTVSPDMAERHGRQLARFAELSLTLAEDVHAAAAAAPEPDEKARLAEAFHRLGRALRQTIAWEARLVRDRARDLKAAEADAAEAGAKAVRRRQEQVRADVERQIYCELDPAEAHAWLADFDERLETEALYDGFTDESVEDHIARLSANLGLTGEVKRNYTPRSCRPQAPGPSRPRGDYDHFFRDVLDADADDDDDEEDADDEDDADGEATEDAAGGRREAEPAEAPPIAPVACGGLPPEPEIEAAPAPEPPPEPPAEPPPRPPDPEPYVPPWDRQPNARFPGGSGY